MSLPCFVTASDQAVGVEVRPIGMRLVEVTSPSVALSVGQQTAA